MTTTTTLTDAAIDAIANSILTDDPVTWWRRLSRAIEAAVLQRVAAGEGEPVAWAVERWNAEVANRPLINKNRRPLDDTWRQVIRHFGGDPDELLGPAHDELVAAAPAPSAPPEPAPVSAAAGSEMENLRAEVAELDALRDKLAGILSRTAVALRGPEPPLTRWSWHDLPERAAAAIAAIGVMQKVAVDLADAPKPCEVCGAAPCGWCDPKPVSAAAGEPSEDRVVYCTIYQTREGLPVMTDSSRDGTWDVRLTFSSQRNAWGDFVNTSPLRIESTPPSPAQSPAASTADQILDTLPEMSQDFLTHHIPAKEHWASDWVAYGRKVEAETIRRARAALASSSAATPPAAQSLREAARAETPK